MSFKTSFAIATLVLAFFASSANATNCNDKCFFGYCKEGSCKNNVCDCGGTKDDPELQGLDGRKFFFDGEKDKCFNLITEQYHQVNALFVEGPHKIASLGSTEDAHNGTYVGSMGFKIYGQKVQIDSNEEGAMTVAINGEPVVLTQQNNFENFVSFDNLNVTTHKYREGLGETVRLVSDVFDFLVYAAPRAWDEETQQMNRGHLNMGLGVKADAYFTRDVHGVLGQITPDTHPDVNALPEELKEAFLGEGEEADYKVSNLWAEDFMFSLYGRQPQRVAVSRRHLREGAAGARQWLSLGYLGSEQAPSFDMA